MSLWITVVSWLSYFASGKRDFVFHIAFHILFLGCSRAWKVRHRIKKKSQCVIWLSFENVTAFCRSCLLNHWSLMTRRNYYLQIFFSPHGKMKKSHPKKGELGGEGAGRGSSSPGLRSPAAGAHGCWHLPATGELLGCIKKEFKAK